ncbi:hypothetical protein D9M68_751400 [compost metagenome]
MAFRRPAVKIGRLICGWNNQLPEPPSNRPDSSLLMLPALAVRLILGKNAARAAPMLALADLSWCSAWSRSGRRCNRSDGKPAGTSASRSWSSTSPPGNSAGRPLPSSSARALRSWATRRVYWARLTWALCTAVRAWLSDRASATPTLKLRSVRA